MFQIEETVLAVGGYALISMYHSSDILPKRQQIISQNSH